MKPYQSYLIFGVLCLLVIGISMLPFPEERDYIIESNDIPSIQFSWESKLVGEKVGSRILIDDSKDRLYVMTFSTLTALALKTGDTLWVNDASGGNQWADHSLQLQGNILLATGKDSPIIRAFSTETGTILWERDYTQNQDKSKNLGVYSILSDPARVYVATYRSLRGTDIDALDLFTGEPLWNISTRLFGVAGSNIFQLTPSRLYIEAGQLFGLDKLTGDVLEAYPEVFIRQKSGYIEDFVAYYVNGSVHAAARSKNKEEQVWHEKWQTNLEGCRDGVDYLLSNPDATTDALYAGATCDTLLKLNKENGHLLWTAETIGTPRAIAIDSSDLFVLTGRANLAQVDIATGEILGTLQFKPKSRYTSGIQALAYSKGWLIVSNGNNQIFGFQKTK